MVGMFDPITLKRVDGSKFESELSTGAIYNEKNEPDSMVILIKNISERKKSERRLGADNLMHLIDDIIDIAKIEAG